MSKAMKISESTLAVLSGSRVDGQVLYLPNVQLAHDEYVTVNKVIEALGGKWDRRAKGHVFADDPADRLDDVMLTGTYEKPNQLEFFATPPVLADRVIALAGIEPGMFVLEPSAGTGALVRAALDAGGHVTSIEIDRRRWSDLDALPKPGGHHPVLRRDFMQVQPDDLGLFHRVVMNPPFSRQQDIDHVAHALTFLKPGGRLVAVMSAAVGFRTNRKTVAFWEAVEGLGRRDIVPNRDKAFAESGTNVNTVTVVIDIDAEAATEAA